MRDAGVASSRRPAEPPETLRLTVLGGLEVEGVSRYELGSRRARELLRELALARGGPVATDALAEVLWGEEQPKDPHAQVAVLVSRLRRVIGPQRIVLADRGYSLRYDWLDLEAAEALADDAAARMERSQFASALAAARGALGLLGTAGPDGVAADPAIARLTARVRHLCTRALLASGDLAGAVEVAQRALDAEAYDEEALRLAMTGMASAGQASAALVLYERFRERLADEFGASPSAATAMAHRAVLRDEPIPGVVVDATPRRMDASTPEHNLVGRDRELAQLNAAFAASGEPRLTRLSVEGEAGIGKTYLIDHWLAGIGHNATVLTARCDLVNPSLPLEPILDALHAHLRAVGPTAAEGLLGPERGVLAPVISGTVDPGEAGFDVALSLAASPAGEAILYAALVSLMERVCARPAVLFIDDFHRSDQATASWLGRLAQRAPDLQLLVIAAQRPIEPRRLAADRVISVDPLTVDAAAAIVGQPRAQRLHQRSGGNPLFLSELGRSQDDAIVPETVQASVNTRCDAMFEAGATLRSAAVLGTSIDVELLTRILGVDPIHVIDHLERASRLAFLEERQGTFAFRHEVVRDALAASAGALRRAWLHRQAAQVLAGNPSAEPLVLAEHARLSGERRIAADALARASAIAMERFDHATALLLVDESLSFEATTPALLQRARIHLWRSRYPEAERDADTALERGDDLRALEVGGAIAYYRRNFTRAHSLAMALLERSDDAGLQLGGLIIGARAAHAAGNLAGALGLFQRAERLARRSALPEPASLYAFLEVHRGDSAHALRVLQDPVRMRRAATASTAYTTVHEHFIGGYALATSGRVTEALDQWDHGAVEAERQGLVRYEALCMNLSSWVYRGIGELNRAREANDAARQAGRIVDYRELEAFAVLDLSEAATLDDDPAVAASWLEQARAMTLEDYAYRWRHLLRIGVLDARAQMDRGDDELALATATAVATQAREHGARRYEMLARLVEMEAAMRLGVAIAADDFRRLCRDLPRLAGPESWALVARAGAITGFGWCAELAAEQADALAVALPEALSRSFRRYAGARLDRTRIAGRSG
jgi:DNA-binding SARP family transcriptional activator/tetratricopeptide (TPR) repeat protein